MQKIKDWFMMTFLFYADEYSSDGHFLVWFIFGAKIYIKNINNMREIKFKIYNKSQNKVFEPYQYKDGRLLLRMWDGKIVDVYEGEKREQLIEDERDNLIPLQFTGFKDKNGKEIYEGDILSVNENIPQAGIFEVIWKDGGFKYIWHIQNQKKEEAITKNSDYLKIIGNIHENKDLI